MTQEGKQDVQPYTTLQLVSCYCRERKERTEFLLQDVTPAFQHQNNISITHFCFSDFFFFYFEVYFLNKN